MPDRHLDEAAVETATHIIPTDLIPSGIHARCLVRDVVNRYLDTAIHDSGFYGAGSALVPEDLLRDVWFTFIRLRDARDTGTQASCMVELSNKMHDLITWHPEYNYESLGNGFPEED
jgi:hypothetical protein